MKSSFENISLNNKLEISGLIERTAKKMRQHFQRILKDANMNITVDQWLVLQVLHERGWH